MSNGIKDWNGNHDGKLQALRKEWNGNHDEIMMKIVRNRMEVKTY